MSRNFNFKDLLNAESVKEAVKTGYSERVDVNDICPSDDNFYSTADVENLKESILLIGLQEPVIVNLTHSEDGYKYRMVSGHRRMKSCKELVMDGFEEFRYIPAIVCDISDPDEEKAVLIMTNSTQRELTGWEKVNQYMELKPTIKSLKEKRRVSGRARELAADALHVSKSQIANYNLIGTSLIQPLMYLFKADKITMELALEAARLSEDEQCRLVDIVEEKGIFDRSDIMKVISARIIEGQQSLIGENVPVTGTKLDEVENVPVTGTKLDDIENVPVTGTNLDGYKEADTMAELYLHKYEDDNKKCEIDNENCEIDNNLGTESDEEESEDENVPVTGTNYERGLYRLEMVDELLNTYSKRVCSSKFIGSSDREYCYIMIDALNLLKSTIG